MNHRQMPKIQSTNQYPNYSKQQQQHKKKIVTLKVANQNQSAKLSTPIRPRLVPTQQLNSTPISVSRKQNKQIPSPLLMKANKQNENNNCRAQPSPSRSNINLKENSLNTLLALSNNSKILNTVRNKSQSPIMKDKIHVKNVSPVGKMSKELKYIQFNTLPSEKNQIEEIPTTKINLNRQTSNKIIQPSKFFSKKNNQAQMIENFGIFATKKNQNNFQRDSNNIQLKNNKKNQILDDIIKNCNKKQEIFRSYGNRNDIFTFNQTQPANKLAQSKSFSKLNPNKLIIKQKSQSNYYSTKNQKFQQQQSDQLMCLNNDGKKAKYRVVNNSPDDQEQQQKMIYCSNCAIFLIQQGFRVQELEQQKKLKLQKNVLIVNEMKNILKKIEQLQNKIKNKNEKMSKIKDQYIKSYEQQINKVDSYYNSLISIIEQARVKDKQTIIKCKDQGKQQLEQNSRKLQYCIKEIEQISINFNQYQQILKKGCNDNQHINQIIRVSQNELEKLVISLQLNEKCQKQIIISQDIQIKFNNFLNNFKNTYMLKIQKENRVDNMVMAQNNFPMHFSFDKNKFKNANKKIENIQQFVKKQSDKQQRYQQIDEINEQARKPFRNLFSDESEAENMLQQYEQNIENKHQKNQFEQQNQKQNQNYDCYSPNFKNI